MATSPTNRLSSDRALARQDALAMAYKYGNPPVVPLSFKHGERTFTTQGSVGGWVPALWEVSVPARNRDTGLTVNVGRGGTHLCADEVYEASVGDCPIVKGTRDQPTLVSYPHGFLPEAVADAMISGWGSIENFNRYSAAGVVFDADPRRPVPLSVNHVLLVWGSCVSDRTTQARVYFTRSFMFDHRLFRVDYDYASWLPEDVFVALNRDGVSDQDSLQLAFGKPGGTFDLRFKAREVAYKRTLVPHLSFIDVLGQRAVMPRTALDLLDRIGEEKVSLVLTQKPLPGQPYNHFRMQCGRNIDNVGNNAVRLVLGYYNVTGSGLQLQPEAWGRLAQNLGREV